MLTIPEWVLSPAEPVPGQAGPLTIVDPIHSPIPSNVYVILGSVVQGAATNSAALLLDENDIANARLIAAAPRMLRVLEDLWSWAVQLGGWEASCWQELDAIVANLRGRDIPTL